MAYQKCPKCGGSGKEFNNLPSMGIPMVDIGNMAYNSLVAIQEAKGMKNICPVCKGKMIISELTGKPPKD